MENLATIANIYNEVFDYAMEGHVIPNKERNDLSDEDFGLIMEENGEIKRKYPLRVPGDKNKTKALCEKAIQFFHFCKGPLRAQLAKNIARVMKEEDIVIKISKKSQILKYISASDLPDGCVVDETVDE